MYKKELQKMYTYIQTTITDIYTKYYKQSFSNIPILHKYDIIVWLDGSIEIIYNNQLLRIPGQFNITSEMIEKMKSFNGVKKIDLVE